MHKKFLRASSFVGCLLAAVLPAQGVQKFSILHASFNWYEDEVKVPSTVASLTFRKTTYRAMPHRSMPGWYEVNVAPDGEDGPIPLYGETVGVNLETYWTGNRSCWGCMSPHVFKTTELRHQQIPVVLTLPPAQNPKFVKLTWKNGYAPKAEPHDL